MIWGTVLKQKNIEIQNRLVDLNDAKLFNDKLAATVESLYARRQITRIEGNEENRSVLTEWEDDVLKRSAAIDRLESLVIERPVEAVRVASMLSIYARELSRQQASASHIRLELLKLVYPDDDSMPLEWEEALHELKAHPDSVELDEFKRWAENLIPWRADVEKAVQVLGRLNMHLADTSDNLKIDLRKTNLQGFDLSGLNFAGADFSKCIAHGVDFSKSNLSGASFEEAEIGGAIFKYSACEEASFRFTKADGVVFLGAKLDNSKLDYTKIEGADFKLSHINGAEITNSFLSST